MPTNQDRFRAGRVVRPPEGYNAFIPAPLPPSPALRFELTGGRRNRMFRFAPYLDLSRT
jgi:hypothetical protein